ncbi:myrcene synthase, chloroplastic isoform X2 [Arachis hypogaea]|uniref:myrcene synthase, chloroplastic isoform X2 n=1 Tax=Arachis hypogaea TaxID=3818 RepID=UPI000DEC29C2|nr:myrcene synthase, chloroplastic isoform X2 [Arachis hypogaea]
MDLPKLASIITSSTFTKVLLPLGKNSSFPATIIRTLNFPCSIQCNALNLVSNDNNNNSSKNQTTDRQIVAKYEPSIWPHEYIQSLNSEYKEETYLKQHHVLKEEVRKMLFKVENHVDQLDLIDVLQRLGVAYLFKSEIRNILDSIHNIDYSQKKKTLHATALEFRILRDHGYDISTDVFVDFLDERDNFKISQSVDIEGILSLYEASFYSWEGESILDEARDFTLKILEKYSFRNKSEGNYLSLLIDHSLEIPLHWRAPRWEAQWFIHAYETRKTMNPSLLEFAKLDYNILQTIHQEDLKHGSRWDPNIIDTLPEYMQLCFLSLYNFVNDLAFEFLKMNGFYIAPYLKKSWTDICKSYLIEAKWFHSAYKPGFEKYVENGWISIGMPVILVHTYFLVPHSFKREELPCIQEYCDMIRFPSTISRLVNDLGTYERESENGDTLKLIQCYMNETRASEKNAKEHIKFMLSLTWKKLNKEAHNSSLPQIFVGMAVNLARMAMCMYNHGDGHTIQDSQMKNRVLSLIVQPIPYKENLFW